MAKGRIVGEFMEEGPIARATYDVLAPAYAERIDSKPHNAFYERPATLSLLPEVDGGRVLDIGCGPGAYAAWLVENGATVVGVDASPRMIEHARARVPDGATFHVADVAAGLDFLVDESFDLAIAPLSLDYLRDWSGPLREIHRTLRSGGCFVMSVGHPFFDYGYFGSDDYFAIEATICEWRGFGPPIQMPSYRRPLDAVIMPLIEAGFTVERVLEPQPTDAFREADPDGYEELMRFPGFLCLRARKRAASSSSR